MKNTRIIIFALMLVKSVHTFGFTINSKLRNKKGDDGLPNWSIYIFPQRLLVHEYTLGMNLRMGRRSSVNIEAGTFTHAYWYNGLAESYFPVPDYSDVQVKKGISIRPAWQYSLGKWGNVGLELVAKQARVGYDAYYEGYRFRQAGAQPFYCYNAMMGNHFFLSVKMAAGVKYIVVEKDKITPQQSWYADEKKFAQGNFNFLVGLGFAIK